MHDFRQVHERQTARMRTRSEWFLTPVGERLAATDSDPTAMHVLRGSNRSSSGNIGKNLKYSSESTNKWFLWLNQFLCIAATGLSASAESVKRPSLRRNSSREKSRLHRSSSRRNKENGAKSRGASESSKSRSLETVKAKGARVTIDQQPAEKMIKNSDELSQLTEQNSTGNAHQQPDIAIGPQDCTEMDIQTFHVTLTYKPRI